MARSLLLVALRNGYVAIVILGPNKDMLIIALGKPAVERAKLLRGNA